MAEFDINKVQGNDRYIAGGAIAFIVLAFFPWRTASLGPLHINVKLFGNGSYGLPKLSLLLAIIAGGVVIARLSGALKDVSLPLGVNLITLAASGLATALLLLQYVFGFKYDAHPGFGFYLGILVSAAMTYFAFLNFKSSGEQLPSQFPGQTGGAAPGYPPPPMAPPASPPTAPLATPMTPQSDVAPPTEYIPQPPPPPAGEDPGYPKTGP